MVTDVIKWHCGPPASKMSYSKLSIQGKVVSMWDTFTTAKTQTGPHKTLDWAAGWTLLI